MTDKQDEPPVWAYLNVVSSVLRLRDLEIALGRSPDESHDIGDPKPRSPHRQFDWSSWRMNLALDESLHAGAEALPEAIENLSDDLADRIAGLTGRDCLAVLYVVQWLDDFDGDSTGLHLTPRAIAWLQRANMSVDVDQYVVSVPPMVDYLKVWGRQTVARVLRRR